MEIIDITREISDGMDVYPGDPKVKIKTVKSLAKDGHTLSEISMGLHSGTHIDAPAHFIKGGKTVDEIVALIGPARVVEGRITPDILTKGEVLIIKGRTGITEKEAEILAKGGIPAIGTDSMSIGSPEVHKILLSKGVMIIENLDLDKAHPGQYQIICLPMKIKGVEAAPVRCLLVSGDK